MGGGWLEIKDARRDKECQRRGAEMLGVANCEGELLVCMLHIYEAGEGKT